MLGAHQVGQLAGASVWGGRAVNARPCPPRARARAQARAAGAAPERLQVWAQVQAHIGIGMDVGAGASVGIGMARGGPGNHNAADLEQGGGTLSKTSKSMFFCRKLMLRFEISFYRFGHQPLVCGCRAP